MRNISEITSRRRWRAAVALALSATLVAGCGGGPGDEVGGRGAGDADTTLILVAFAVPDPGWSMLSSAFSDTEQGEGVAVTTSYGASAEQSRSVAAGKPADVVNFSVEPDLLRLVEAGEVDENWDAGVTKGIPFGSVVSFAVRPGNPQNIRDWPDLLRPGVEVITPSPLSSGSAKWNLLAPYAWASDGGRNPQAGLDFISELVTDHVRALPSSGREATDVFKQGTGDVLLAYENEALNFDLDYVNPPQTIKIENPVAVVNTSQHLEQAIDFVNFQYTPEGQRLWAAANFRPVDPGVLAEFTDKFPAPQKLWTIDDLGGWQKVDPQLFDNGSGTIAEIYRQATG